MLDDFREWLSDNLRYILLGLAVLLVLIIGFCIFRLVNGGKSQDSGTSGNTTATEKITEKADSQETETDGSGEQSGTEAQAPSSTGDSALVKDDPAVLSLVQRYYNAAASKDITTLESIVDPWNKEIEDSILQNTAVESYNNIATYSKDGPVSNSYVVYTYFDGKVSGIDTLVPSLTMLYVKADSNGDLKVADKDENQDVSDYISKVTADNDVQTLRKNVDAKLEEAMAADPALKTFFETQPSEDDQEAGGDTAGDTAAPATGEMVSTAELNIRQEPNTSAAIMGVVTTGAQVTKLQDVEGGWCQISYAVDGYTIEGYVKSEYLTPAGSSN